jgi:hypothetical protein
LAAFSAQLRNLRTSPSIRKTPVRLMSNSLLGTPMSSSHESPEVRSAIRSQMSLGRQQFFCGRLIKLWAPLQQSAFQNYAPWLSGISWASQVISAIWDMSFHIWSIRNDILHNSDVLDTLLDMDRIDFVISEQWHMGPSDIHAYDKHYFRGISLDELLAKSSRYRRDWLFGVQAARNDGDPSLEPDHDLDDPPQDDSTGIPPHPPLLHPVTSPPLP